MKVFAIALLLMAGVSHARYADLLGADDDHYDAQYLVRFKSREDSESLRSHNAMKSLHFNDDGHRLFYAHGHLSDEELDAIRKLVGVDYVSHNKVLQFAQSSTVDTNPGSWGLDRIDQRQLPLDGNYSWTNSNSGSGVSIFVVDSGVSVDHPGFGGKAKFLFDCVQAGEGVCSDSTDTGDFLGHGTAVAGVAGSQTHGVARDAELLSIRVGNMSLGLSWIAALNGIVEAIKYADDRPSRRFVMNLSWGRTNDADTTMDEAVLDAIDAGIVVVIAAGNSGINNTCDITPGRVSEAITVAASEIDDKLASLSSYGPCTDLIAPGNQIVTLAFNYESVGLTRTVGGTSFAAPHVAGVAAMWLSADPSMTPAQVKQSISAFVAVATKDVIDLGSATTTTPNRLLHNGQTFCTCSRILNPVCGSNGVTYSNACIAAQCAEVESYQAGACSESKLLQENGKALVCRLPADTGLCYAAIPRWHYNTTSRECELFTYGGCGGNGNNFVTKRQCETVCSN